MWHEVRKQERKIRCMIVDYKRRAERRKDYYEKIKADPTQFLQIHGRPCKIHLDPAVTMAGDSPSVMMSWQGNPEIVIDRFDVRAHLDYIEEYRSSEEPSQSYEDRHINYERFRILVQNDFLGVSEEKFLHQLHLEEQFGVVSRGSEPIEGKKKITGAAIGFNYDDPTAPPPQSSENDHDDDDDEDSDIDFDVCVDVNKVSTQQAHELNSSALPYGMESNDFFSFLTKDREEADNLKLAKELEEEKAMYSGRKSRRERRAYREKKLAGRVISPPSYASKKSPTYRDYRRDSRSNSRSRSLSPDNSGKITYITSFSGEEPEKGPVTRVKADISVKDNIRTVNYKPVSSFSRRSKSRSGSPPPTVRRRRSRSGSRTRYKPNSDWKSPKSKSTLHRSPSRSSSRPSVHSSSSTSDSPRPLKVAGCEALVKQPPPPVISRYYGRRGGSSSSELSLSEDEEKDDHKFSSKISDKKSWAVGNSSSRNKPPGPSTSQSRMTPQERLKKKMQALINKQYKADKKAEREKREKVEQERMDREDEMREMSIKLRKRLRRTEYLNDYDGRSSSRSNSRSRSRSRTRSYSRSRSRSPKRRERRRRTRSRTRSRSRSYERDRHRSSHRSSRPLVDY